MKFKVGALVDVDGAIIFIPKGTSPRRQKKHFLFERKHFFLQDTFSPSQGDLCLQALKILFKGGRCRMVLEPYLVGATAKLHKRAEKRMPAGAPLWQRNLLKPTA